MKRSFLLVVSLLLALPLAAAAQSDAQKPKPRPEAKPLAEFPDKGEVKPKPEAQVLEVERVGRPGCEIKPVMTDDEIEACRRAAYERR